MRSKRFWFLIFILTSISLTPVLNLQPFHVKKSNEMPSEIAAETRVVQASPVHAAHPEISVELYSKVLLTAEEKAKLHAELSNPDLIRKAYFALTKFNTNEPDRFQTIDYFEKAIMWQDNPERQQIIDSLRNILLLDNLMDIEDIQLRKSYAGDKIEIYALLKQHAPEELEVINSLPQDGRIKKLLSYAEKLTKS